MFVHICPTVNDEKKERQAMEFRKKKHMNEIEEIKKRRKERKDRKIREKRRGKSVSTLILIN